MLLGVDLVSIWLVLVGSFMAIGMVLVSYLVDILLELVAHGRGTVLRLPVGCSLILPRFIQASVKK